MAIVDNVIKTFAVLVVAVAVIFFIRWIRPRLREQRHRRWEEAGLLPHQVDPYAPREEPKDPKD
jgi:hypothetical protein